MSVKSDAFSDVLGQDMSWRGREVQVQLRSQSSGFEGTPPFPLGKKTHFLSAAVLLN